jgi:hypothetical protein
MKSLIRRCRCPTKKIVVALLWALLALAASGCGGSSDPQPLSSETFTKQAKQICVDAKAKVEKEAQSISGELSGSSAEEQANYVSHFLVPWVGTAMSEIGDLGLPENDAKQAEDMIASYESTLAKLEAEPQLAFGKKDPFASANKMATKLGLTDCVV